MQTSTPSNDGRESVKRRSRAGCITCRRRHTKCDEQHPVCNRCAQGGSDCVWHEEVPALVKSSRRRACRPCRDRKSRCGGRGPDETCSTCQRRATACEWSDEESSMINEPELHAVVPSAHSQAKLWGDRLLVQSLTEQYFRTAHLYTFNTFVNPVQFKRLFDRGRLSKNLVVIMAALAVRFSGEASTEAMRDADTWVDSVVHSILGEIHKGFGALHVMTTQLAHFYQIARGHHSSGWLLAGNAMRMTQALRLHTFDDSYPLEDASAKLSPLLQPEALRRLAWSTFFVDTLLDMGQHGLHTVTDNTYRMQLPARESVFMYGQGQHRTEPLWARQGDQVVIGTGENLGLAAHLMRIVAMRRRVLHFSSTLKFATAPINRLWDSLLTLGRNLAIVLQSLPERYSAEPHAIQAYLANGSCPTHLTRLFVVHTLRENARILYAKAQLLVCEKGGVDRFYTEQLVSIKKDRIRTALRTSDLIKAANDLNVHLDPLTNGHAYAALEVLLFEPLQVYLIDQTVDPKEASIALAIRCLFDAIATFSRNTAGGQHLRVEAIVRIVRTGYTYIFTEYEQFEMKLDKLQVSGDLDEYNFRDLKELREESVRRIPRRRSPDSPYAMLNFGADEGSVPAPAKSVGTSTSPPSSVPPDVVRPPSPLDQTLALALMDHQHDDSTTWPMTWNDNWWSKVDFGNVAGTSLQTSPLAWAADPAVNFADQYLEFSQRSPGPYESALEMAA